MEQGYRIALWMFCLIGYLQANPICSKTAGQGKNPQGKPFNFNMDDLGFTMLHEDVTCGLNVTFTSPTDVQEHCYTAALKCIMEGLKQAMTNCTDDEQRISSTLDALNYYSGLTPECPTQRTLKNSSECKWEDEGSLKQFAAFVKDTETLVQKLNSLGK